MINLALVITHNKTDKENQAQIEFLKPLINKVTELVDDFDEQGNVTGQHEIYHYELDGLVLPHELKVYQILPYQLDNTRLKQGLPYEGVWPINAFDIDSHKVAYGKGDEDKLGDHPRFFNWGLKRGTDYGANIVIYVDDYKTLDFSSLITDLQKLNDKLDKTELVDKPEVTIGTLKLLKEVGSLDETKVKTEAISLFKQRIIDAGLELSED